MSAFRMTYEPLLCDGAVVGRIGTIPWDSEIFERVVAAFELEDPPRAGLAALGAALDGWIEAHGARTVTATLPAGSAANALLQRLGFTFVELSLETYFVPKGELARPAAALRQAEEIDWPGIERIAGSAFRHGRYHADPGFPSELADRRYIRWMRNARAATSHGATHGDIVYVLGEAGAPRAFFHVALREDGVGDLRLGAVDPQASNGMLGVALYRGVIAALRELGARSFVTRLSASNTAVLNLFASMGFLFRDPTCIYNRHTPEQP